MNIRPEIQEWIDALKANPEKVHRGYRYNKGGIERVTFDFQPTIEPTPRLQMKWMPGVTPLIWLFSTVKDSEGHNEIVELSEEEKESISKTFHSLPLHVPVPESRQKEILDGARLPKLS
jgi:hypothetical protein